MNILVENILAAMIAVIPPGMSTYSQVPVSYCDVECQSTPRCDNPTSFKCKAPELNKELLALKYLEFESEGLTEEETTAKATPYAFSRPETYEEGLARYYVIAESVVASARRNSYGACIADNQCKDQPDTEGEGSLVACYKQCESTAIWKRSYKDLAWALFTVSSYESGWRSDVHAGVGEWGRGDCKWTKGNVYVPAWTKGGTPQPNTCNSYGLTQVWFGVPARTLHDTRGAVTYDMVLGLDEGSTEQSFDLAARFLAMAYRACNGVEGQTWALGMFSMYGSGSGCTKESSKLREGRFWKYSRTETGLAQRHLDTLVSPYVQELVALLQNGGKRHWMPSEDYVPVTTPPQELAVNL